MPPEDTAILDTPPTDTPPPAAPVAPPISEEAAALIASMKPGNMVANAPAPAQMPALPTTDPNAPPATPAAPQQPGQPKVPSNFAELRRIKEGLEKTTKEQQQKIDDLQARIDGGEESAKVTKQLQAKLDTLEAKFKDTNERLFRVSAKDSAEYQEHFDLIQAAENEIGTILKLPEVSDYAPGVLPGDLSDPHKLNAVLRALHEGGKYAEADDLKKALTAKSVWGNQLQQIEAKSAESRKAWESNRDNAVRQQLRQTAAGLAAHNPALVVGSPEFKALPAEAQEFVTEAHKKATESAMNLFKDTPERQVDQFYANQLALHLKISENGGLSTALEQANARVAELETRLRGYEQHTSRPAAQMGDGATGGTPTPQELARQLSPSRMRH
jgi:uncharacterized coiled-coil protein SlyX